MPRTTNQCYVWVWLPGAGEPVVAGRLDDSGPVTTFTYGRSYLENSDAVSLYEPELPLTRGAQTPLSGVIAGCIADAGPDSWGRRIIEHRRAADAADLTVLDYLMASGSDRIGALDFQESPEIYRPRVTGEATLDELVTAAELVEQGEPLTPTLESALLHGTSVGGARPKALVADGERRFVAKFSSTTDSFPVVKAEFLAMDLARQVGLDVPEVEKTTALGKDILLVERFDRRPGPTRRQLVSALTILELHDADGMAGRYATYVDLASQVRARFGDPRDTLRELFRRIAFNILVGNTDDHARNLAAFWNGSTLQLTPAYDICPQSRTGGETAQAMAYGEAGERESRIQSLVASSQIYHLTTAEAQEIVDHQVDTINTRWGETADRAGLTTVERQRLWGRQILNPYAFS